MSSTYTVTDYLLDRANIHDTVTKLPWYYDTRSEAGLLSEVFAPEVHIDYTRILGSEPSTVAATEWAPQVVRMCEHFDSSQHIYGNLIIELPQPNTPNHPDKAKVLVSQAGASMVRAAAEGGPLLQNGCCLSALKW
ncbi:hypothetical protein M406DRAFT_72265 [Cryphonectria parasitica EP155]|uniref:SnoaL-like domain-containing protein n=1 Tax=Cryphonectria parasitica (strain ATCC 38755 / EP155) TaxID=660469 RepID=A0A9P4XVV6_CRYP1|nr:uncharacterized protein M406DRAFT_72265 [Cryphonectria parasitica EP155]KAF3762247.1 hypothetical protein M406DRAFT_72265 [Cryphonectria parasitica EP155]